MTSHNSLSNNITLGKQHLGTNDYLLPRSAWNNRIAYLRAIFKAKKALDVVESKSRI